MKLVKQTKSKGSFTVEAVIVFTVCFYCLLLILFMGMLLYQQAKMQTIAVNAAQRGAELYTHKKKDYYMGKVSLASLAQVEPYWRFFDWGGDSNEKVNKVKNALELNMSAYNVPIFSSVNESISVKATNHFMLYRDITVDISSDYKVPVPEILTRFGAKAPFPLSARAVAPVNEPAEFIRNIDFGADIINKNEIISKLKNKIGEFFSSFSKNS